MKLLIVLAVVGLSNAAKLDNTYLPPSNAPTAGGSGNFLETFVSGTANEYQKNSGFGTRTPAVNNYAQNGQAVPASFGQNTVDQGNNFAQTGTTFSGPTANNYARTTNNYAENGQLGSQRFGQNAVEQGNNFAQAEESGFGAAQNYRQSPNVFGQNTGTFAQPNFVQNDNFPQSAAFGSRPERPRAALERNAAILRQDTQNDGETYAYAYETENGITAEENGVATNGVEAQGGFSYVGDDGQIYSIRYTADQNGFVPEGDHLPTPPPVPAEILKALEDNARDEANGIYDDGTYNEAKYGDNSLQGYNENANVGEFGANQGNEQVFNGVNNGFNGNNYSDNDDTVVTNNALLRSGAAQSPAYNQNQAGSFRGQTSMAQNNQAAFTQGNQGGYNNQGSFGQRIELGNQRQRNQYDGQGNQYSGQGSQGSRNEGVASSGNREYLPPFQRSNGESSRRQSFNARTGYQY